MSQAPVDDSGPRTPVLSCRNVGKRYGRLVALADVNLDVYPGEVVGLVGDNGAGKSTLLGILAGAHAATVGTVYVDGRPVAHSGPDDARMSGIETVYQDLSLSLDLSIADNLFMGREVVRGGLLGRMGWLDDKQMQQRTRSELDRLRIPIPDVNRPCAMLSGGQRQAVAVARAAAWGSRIVLMDEPTAALGVEEQDKVAALILSLRSHGTPVLLVSHNLPQVLELTDRILVLRHGRLAAELITRETDLETVVLCITGGAHLRRANGGDVRE